MRKNNAKISIDLPVEIRDILINEAQNKEMSLSGYIRLIIKQYLAKNNQSE